MDLYNSLTPQAYLIDTDPQNELSKSKSKALTGHSH